ncbi:MAG: response regulator [Phycisphaeraceae bacterium]|nr:response regulator [Phycisphaeraceae bacterium]
MTRSPNPSPSRRPSGVLASSGRVNTVGLNRRELDEILDSFEGANTDAENAPVRKYIRRRFRHTRIPMQVFQPGGGLQTFPVACRNISTGGLSVLHNAYVHLGTPCTIALPMPTGSHVSVRGQVVRCSHRRGMVHELGIKFDEALDTRLLLSNDLFADFYTREQVDPADLRGTLLCIDDSAADRRLIRYYLRDTNMQVVAAEDADSGLDKALEGVDLIVCSLSLPGPDGIECVASIRGRSIATPVILVTADDSTVTRERVEGIDVQACLVKPLSQPLLLRAAAEFLLRAMPAGKAPGPTTAERSPSMAAGFLANLRGDADRLEYLLRNRSTQDIRKLCTQLRETTPHMGLAGIGGLADTVLKAMERTGGATGATEELGRLIEACRSANARRRAG